MDCFAVLGYPGTIGFSYCTVAPCCSDDCSAFTICDLTGATIPVYDLSTALWEANHSFW
jgi:hypothetical protein